MGRKRVSLGHRASGGLSCCVFKWPARALALLASGLVSVAAQTTPAAPVSQPPQQETAKPTPLTQPEISQLQAKAEGGDSSAQVRLGKAYLDGNGVPQNDALAFKWFRKAADQGDAAAENELGIIYRMGKELRATKKKQFAGTRRLQSAAVLRRCSIWELPTTTATVLPRTYTPLMPGSCWHRMPAIRRPKMQFEEQLRPCRARRRPMP